MGSKETAQDFCNKASCEGLTELQNFWFKYDSEISLTCIGLVCAGHSRGVALVALFTSMRISSFVATECMVRACCLAFKLCYRQGAQDLQQ